MISESRIAFVVDPLVPLGGAEKVLFAALEAFPHADIFTLVYNKPVFTNTLIATRKIRTTHLNRLPFVEHYHRYLLPFMPAAIERIDLHNYDFIVSFNYAVANGVKNHNGARHVSYTHTPLRYAWTDLNIDGTRSRRNPMLDTYLRFFRTWDRRAASRVHAFATNSQVVSQRIRRAYGRDAQVIHPPVDVDRFRPNPRREKYFVTVTRLVRHKRVDLLVQAFNQLNLPLVIIGDGPELPRLKAMAGGNINFTGYVTDEKVAEYLGEACAFVTAAEEDFGIAIVEAQAAGCPVIAYGSGGARETVVENVTGLFFQEQTPECLADAVLEFEQRLNSFPAPPIAQHSLQYNKPRFISQFKAFVRS